MDMAGDTIRTFSTKIDTGFTRIYWNMREDGVQRPSRQEPKKDADLPTGERVLPGTYKMVFVKNDSLKDSTNVVVKADPRLERSMASLKKERAAKEEIYAYAEKGSDYADRLRKAQKSIKLIDMWMENAPDSTKTKIAEQGGELNKSIGSFFDKFTGLENKKGYFKQPPTFNSHMWQTLGRISQAEGETEVAATAQKLKMERFTNDLFTKIDKFFAEDWVAYKTAVKALDVPLFKD